MARSITKKLDGNLGEDIDLFTLYLCSDFKCMIKFGRANFINTKLIVELAPFEV